MENYVIVGKGKKTSGRTIEDSSRDITNITYSHLDRPGSMEFGDGSSVTYTYSATGQKLSSTYSRNLPTGERSETRYYCGGAEFARNGTASPALSRCNTAWGYIDSKSAVHFYARDYQGNIRGVMSSTGAVLQTTDYYPYGTPMQSSTGAEVNRYKYSGKEFETEGGLNHYDFEARTLIPQTCLFSIPDPKAGDYPGLNPYLYCAANPLKYIDPSGKKLHAIFAGNDDIFEIKYNDDNNIALYDGKGNEVNVDSYTTDQQTFMGSINQLSKSITAMQVINNIIFNKQDLNVEVTYSKVNQFDYITGTVSWNPSDQTGGVWGNIVKGEYSCERLPEIGLIHEIIHGEDYLMRNSDNKLINNHIEQMSIENNVCQKENLVRAELRAPIRISYLTNIIDDRVEPNWGSLISNYFLIKIFQKRR